MDESPDKLTVSTHHLRNPYNLFIKICCLKALNTQPSLLKLKACFSALRLNIGQVDLRMPEFVQPVCLPIRLNTFLNKFQS